LGLSTQVPMKVIFMTDGIPRKITNRKAISKLRRASCEYIRPTLKKN
jgi:hypothetical protein